MPARRRLSSLWHGVVEKARLSAPNLAGHLAARRRAVTDALEGMSKDCPEDTRSVSGCVGRRTSRRRGVYVVRWA